MIRVPVSPPYFSKNAVRTSGCFIQVAICLDSISYAMAPLRSTCADLKGEFSFLSRGASSAAIPMSVNATDAFFSNMFSAICLPVVGSLTLYPSSIICLARMSFWYAAVGGGGPLCTLAAIDAYEVPTGACSLTVGSLSIRAESMESSFIIFSVSDFCCACSLDSACGSALS